MNALDPKRTRYVTSLWEVDPAGETAARRLSDAGCDVEIDGCWSLNGQRLAVDSRDALQLLRAGAA